jgi:hypothetical protein
MSNAYPLDFPCVSRIEGHSAALSAGLVRTPMTAGNSRQRRSFRNLPTMLSLVFVIRQDEYASWLSWVNTFAWDDWIEIKLPGLHASAQGEDTTPTLVRFCSDLQAELLPVHRLWYWRVRVSAEYQPSAGDYLPVSNTWIVGGTPAVPSVDYILGGWPASHGPDFTNPGTPAFPVVFV